QPLGFASTGARRSIDDLRIFRRAAIRGVVAVREAWPISSSDRAVQEATVVVAQELPVRGPPAASPSSEAAATHRSLTSTASAWAGREELPASRTAAEPRAMRQRDLPAPSLRISDASVALTLSETVRSPLAPTPAPIAPRAVLRALPYGAGRLMRSPPVLGDASRPAPKPSWSPAATDRGPSTAIGATAAPVSPSPDLVLGRQVEAASAVAASASVAPPVGAARAPSARSDLPSHPLERDTARAALVDIRV